MTDIYAALHVYFARAFVISCDIDEAELKTILNASPFLPMIDVGVLCEPRVGINKAWEREFSC